MSSSLLATFTYRDCKIRVVRVDGAPWFVARDLAKALDYRSASQFVRGVKAKYKQLLPVATAGGEQMMTAVNEAGLYLAALRAKTDRAEPFQEWVVDEMIPAIRRTGSLPACCP